MHRSVFGSSRLLLALLLASCSSATEPATSIPVTLVRGKALAVPPSFALAGGTGAIEATWDTYGGACDAATAVAERAGNVVTIHVVPLGELPRVCIMIAVPYRYVAHVGGLPPGRYRVRVVEEREQPSREIGNGVATVAAGT